ncbi:MAG: PorV/PorQ family protein [Gemmatimonadota bacterium]|nr:MAG: PorV/PorQ family protein [Gemmatimonadota bacterium]
MKTGKVRAVTVASTAVLCLLLCFGFAQAQKKVGTTAAPFLGIGVGPRAAAMGGAGVAAHYDASCLYWNPGALSRVGLSQFEVGRSQFMVSHAEWFLGTDFNWAGLMLNMGNLGTMGVSFTQLDYGQERVTYVYEEDTGEEWGAYDLAVGLSYARNLTSAFSIGGTWKFIQQRVWNETASGIAFDVGLLFITDFNNMRLGMSICNFGSDMQLDGKDLLQRVDLDPETQGHNETIVSKLKTDSWPLPLLFRVGLAYDLVNLENRRFTVTADALRPTDNSETLNIGGEFAINDLLFLRGGYKSLFRQDSYEGLTFGAGFLYDKAQGWSLNVDYAYTSYDVLQDVHIFSLGIGF